MSDTILTGVGLNAISASNLLVTPTGGTQTTLANALTGSGGVSGPVAASTLSASGTVTMSGAGQNITLAPTYLSPAGGGNVSINPASLAVNPTTGGTIDNVSIGGRTPLAAVFTTMSATTGFGAFGTAPVTVKPDVTGAKGENAALASLLTALASFGLITDSTTA
jgi:hypothetical protein